MSSLLKTAPLANTGRTLPALPPLVFISLCGRQHPACVCWRLHYKDKIPIFQNKYSQKRNIGVSVPIYTFMRLWVIYIFQQSVWLFCWRKYVDWSWDYINRSQTHECGNWGWGRAIPRKGIHKWDLRCSGGHFVHKGDINGQASYK